MLNKFMLALPLAVLWSPSQPSRPGCRAALTLQFLRDGQPRGENVPASSLDVPGDIADSPEVEGGREGDTIRFQILGFDADQTRGMPKRHLHQLNLTGTAGPVPPVAQD